MSDIAPAKTTDIPIREEKASVGFSGKPVSIRVAPHTYFAALFLLTFFAGFLVYLEYDYSAALIFGISWLIFPALAWTDRIAFDGKFLTRTGFLPRAWAWINTARYRLRVTDIEQVETQALRALKRGGNVFYRYRTSVHGRDLRFAFASGGEEYRQMIHYLFPRLSENTLDNRSIELRDYLQEPKETLMKAEFEKIPSADVLESSITKLERAGKNLRANGRELDRADFEKAEDLRQLGNELRVAGYLLQALEAFRRALVINPRDAWLLFDFARCLHSYAGAERNQRLEHKAFAALRLAEKRGRGNGEFLARLGESYFQYGDWQRAGKVFQKSIEIAEKSFRSVRGLAEIALREGKIAHVIHHFAAAQRYAETPALRRWTQGETEYFSRLNTDEDYMDLEISRVNMLETLDNAKKTTLRILFFGFPAIIAGLMFNDLLADIGWAISCVSILIWLGLTVSQRLLAERVPLDFDDEDDEN